MATSQAQLAKLTESVVSQTRLKMGTRRWSGAQVGLVCGGDQGGD
jgi:hypothetical protein